MRISKRVLWKKWCLSLFICTVVFYPKFVFAAASISISPTPAEWALGAKRESTEWTSTTVWTITNDSNGTEDVLIKVTSSGTWTASSDGTQTVNDKFVLRKDNSTGQILTATDWTLAASLANNGTNSFGLYFKTPPTGSEQGDHTLTVTLTATNWLAPCDGWRYAGYCWYESNLGATCSSTCETHGGCVAPTVTQQTSYDVCLHFEPTFSTWCYTDISRCDASPKAYIAAGYCHACCNTWTSLCSSFDASDKRQCACNS